MIDKLLYNHILSSNRIEDKKRAPKVQWQPQTRFERVWFTKTGARVNFNPVFLFPKVF